MSAPRILIVEDEAVVSLDIASQLEALGYQVSGRATTAEQALLLARDKQPDLVLMDIRINGGTDGIDAAQQLRDQFRLPVVFLTAFAEDATLERAKKVQPLGYILKPFEDRELKTVIEMAIYKHRAEVALQQVEQCYREIFNGANTAIFVHDEDTGAILDVNDSMLSLFGFTREEALNLKTCDGSFGASPYSEKEARDWMARTVAYGPQVFEWQARKKSGEVFWVEVALKKAVINGQRRILAVVREITAHKQAEEALRRLNTELAALNRLTRTVTAQLSLEETCRSATRELVAALELDLAAVSVCEGNNRVLKAFAPSSFSGDLQGSDMERLTECLFGLASRSLQPTYSRDIREDCRCTLDACKSAGFRSLGVIPMLRGNEVVGLLGVASKSGRDFSLSARFLETAAEQIAVGIHNARLFEQTRANAVELEHQIAERRKAEQTLRESEERYRALVNGMKDILYVVSVQGWLQFIGPQCHAYGYSEAELLGRNFFDFVLPEDHAAVLNAFRHTATTGKETTVVFRLPMKDGSVRWFEESGRPVRDAAGHIVGVSGLLRDVTERKLAEDHIRQQAALLQESHDAILVWDVERGVQFMNPAAETLTGRKLADALGAGLPEVLRLRSELALRAALLQVTTSGSWNGVLTLLTPQGRECDLESRWSMLPDDTGKPREVLITCNDVTEKKRLEAQYLRIQRLESVGTLASGVAHDINNILSPIIMGADILHESLQDPKVRNILAMMQESALRGRDTVKQLLTFARGAESRQGPVQPRLLVGEIVRLAQQTFPKNIQIYTDFVQEPATVLADSSQLHQVLMNLCLNARDAMPDGGVLFITVENKTLDESSANLHPKARPVPYVVFKVSDSGTGIPPQILDRIFDPFYTTKPQGKGTGLGLATVLGIVESHNGFVLVESQPGHGASFLVHIPAGTPAPAETATLQPHASPRGHDELVLVVDDEKAILGMMERVLARGGYGILTASNASEAMQLCQTHSDRIRAVLTDIMMPFGDGRQLITWLHEQNPNLPIVAMSGLATEDIQQDILHRGGCAFLRKPFSSDQLLAAISTALKSRTPVD